MKKAKKLVLNRETLHHLQDREAAAVAGGLVSNLCTKTSAASCPQASCGCTTGTAADSVVECTSYAY